MTVTRAVSRCILFRSAAVGHGLVLISPLPSTMPLRRVIVSNLSILVDLLPRMRPSQAHSLSPKPLNLHHSQHCRNFSLLDIATPFSPSPTRWLLLVDSTEKRKGCRLLRFCDRMRCRGLVCRQCRKPAVDLCPVSCEMRCM